MKLSLSTNWLNKGEISGEEIADTALALGFDELELGFRTTIAQVAGFKRRLDKIKVGSIHAFCPVPVSAPCGHPELYLLANPDAEARRMAIVQVRKNIRFASEIGADTVVLHAGRVWLGTFFKGGFSSADLRELAKKSGGIDSAKYAKALCAAMKRRVKRGKRLYDGFCRALEELLPDLERTGVVLGLENLPYLEAFPAEWELVRLWHDFVGAPVKGWFDTGHDLIRKNCAWTKYLWENGAAVASLYAGMHLNDIVKYDDDHLAPGDGAVDFAALRDFARNVPHVVFEPKATVTRDALSKSIRFIRNLWESQEGAEQNDLR